MLAIVLARRDFREVDQLITVYSKKAGRLDLLARGVKKITSKNSSHLEPISLVEVGTIPGKKELNYLAKAQLVTSFKNIKSDLAKSLAAGYSIDLVNKLADGDNSPAVFDLVQSWLLFLDNSKFNESLVPALVIKLASLLGFQPELDRCVITGSTDNLTTFHTASGGLVSKVAIDHGQFPASELLPCSPELITHLRELLASNWDQITQLRSNHEALPLLQAFISYHSDRKLADFSKIARVYA